MNFNKALENIKESGKNIEVKTIDGDKYRGQLEWYDTYDICMSFSNDKELIFFKANLIYIRKDI